MVLWTQTGFCWAVYQLQLEAPMFDLEPGLSQMSVLLSQYSAINHLSNQ